MFTPHATHDHFHPSCSVCRWERLTPEQQAQARLKAHQQGQARWERKSPDAQAAGREQAADWWRRLSPEQQAGYRERGAAAWRRQNPERAARRDAILAGRSPEPCGDCGASDATAFVTDYEQGIVRWLCHACARASRPAFERAARRAA
jgi:hypothetical protein